MTNTNNKLPELPEEIINKIILMSYEISPHPTAQVINGTIKSDKTTLSDLNQYLRKLTLDQDTYWMDKDCSFDPAQDCMGIIHYLHQELPKDIGKDMKYSDVKNMIKYCDDISYHSDCGDWMDTSSCHPVETYALCYCFHLMWGGEEEDEDKRWVFPGDPHECDGRNYY